jgi:hypothetical protein
MTVSHGINFKGELLNDTWVLHLSGTLGKWVCTHGDGPDCSQSAAIAKASDSPTQPFLCEIACILEDDDGAPARGQERRPTPD